MESRALSSTFFITPLSHFSASMEGKVGREKNTQEDPSVSSHVRQTSTQDLAPKGYVIKLLQK